MPQKHTPDAVIATSLHAAGFAEVDSDFDSISVASDGNVYYTLGTHHIDAHARVYRYTPGADAPAMLCDLGEVVGEAGKKTIPQGKSHTQFHEHDGKLFFATHYGYYNPASDKEEPADAPPGYESYPGGHFLSYDMADGRFDDLGKAPSGEGIITLNTDPVRGRLYGLTWPRGLFIYHDLETARTVDLGPVSLDGEYGDGERYFCLCRSFGVVPEDGSVYFTNADGAIWRYDYASDRIEAATVSLKRDVFGTWDAHQPGHQGYNWRKILWHPKRKVFFGVHPRSAHLFTFDPATGSVEILARIAADELRANGRFEPFRYGYLGIAWGTDGDTLYYLTGTHGLEADDGRTVNEVLHLVTYDTRNGQYADHGVLRLDDGRYPTSTQTIAVHPAGRIYTVPWIEDLSKDDPSGELLDQNMDLVSFAAPLAAC